MYVSVCVERRERTFIPGEFIILQPCSKLLNEKRAQLNCSTIGHRRTSRPCKQRQKLWKEETDWMFYRTFLLFLSASSTLRNHPSQTNSALLKIIERRKGRTIEDLHSATAVKASEMAGSVPQRTNKRGPFHSFRSHWCSQKTVITLDRQAAQEDATLCPPHALPLLAPILLLLLLLLLLLWWW